MGSKPSKTKEVSTRSSLPKPEKKMDQEPLSREENTSQTTPTAPHATHIKNTTIAVTTKKALNSPTKQVDDGVKSVNKEDGKNVKEEKCQDTPVNTSDATRKSVTPENVSDQYQNKSRNDTGESVIEVSNKKDVVEKSKDVQSSVEKETNSLQPHTTLSSKTEDKAKISDKNVPKSPSPEKMSASKTTDKPNTEPSDFSNLAEKDQKCFDKGVRTCNMLIKPEDFYRLATGNVSKIQLNRSLPSTISLTKLLENLPNLQILDLSMNNMGPQAFRTICMAMCSNITITSLNLANNQTDTNSAECIGKMLTVNSTLQYLDVSSNNLGKDYFSRCVGPALKTNKSLTTLKAQSIGSVDMKELLKGLMENHTIVELDLSNNQITDRCCLGEAFGKIIQDEECELKLLSLCNCNMSSEGIKHLLDGLKINSSLIQLNVSGNEFTDGELLYRFLAVAFQHPTLSHLSINDARISNTTFDINKAEAVEVISTKMSPMVSIELNSSKIQTTMLSCLAERFNGKLCNLYHLDLSNNPDLKPQSLQSVVRITADSTNKSSVRKLSYGTNDCESLSESLQTHFTNLEYLNVRKGRCSMEKLDNLSEISKNKDIPLTTLVLDGLKLSGTDAMKALSASLPLTKIAAISFDGCSLADSDLEPLYESLNQGAQLHMLKLSANRLTDLSISRLVDILLSKKNVPLAVLDVSNNELGDQSASELSKLYTKKDFRSSLHSINLQSNNIGADGIMELVSCVGLTSSLHTLYINKQRHSLEESQVVDIGLKLADSLGYTVQMKDGEIAKGVSSLPTLPEGFHVNISGLGGSVGDIGCKIDCPAIVTDLSARQLLTLSLSNVVEIAAMLKGSVDGECVLTDKEFDHITGSDKDREVPSWLKLPAKRDLALYLSSLPGNATVNKVEALFDMEADCSVDEVCLIKDPVSRCNNGNGWVLMADETSVNKAVQFFQDGECKIFGQPFMLSRVNVKVDVVGDTQAEMKARQDMEERMKERKKEDAAHRQLIQRNTEESWKRHAYRLAHPAYADGRIW